MIKKEIKIRLRPVEESDLYQLKEWRNDPEVMYRVREFKMLSNVNQRNWFESLYKDRFPQNLMFSIEHLKDTGCVSKVCDDEWEVVRVPVIIGCCGLCNIDYINRSAEISLYVGDKRYQHKGVGTNALFELKKKAFIHMNFIRLWAEVYSGNEIIYSLLKKSGYKKEATLKNTTYKVGCWEDSHFFTLFKEDQ